MTSLEIQARIGLNELAMIESPVFSEDLLSDEERYELMEGDGCSEEDYGKEPLTNEENEED